VGTLASEDPGGIGGELREPQAATPRAARPQRPRQAAGGQPHEPDIPQRSPLARALSAVGDHWTLAIVQTLGGESLRPVQLQRRLTGISSGALDRHIRQMAAAGLLLRRRFREMPPRVELTLTTAGRELLPITEALTAWAERHV